MKAKSKISSDAKVADSIIADGVKVFDAAEVKGSRLGENSMIGDQTVVLDSKISSNVSINRRNYILKSEIGRFSYTGIGTSIRSAQVGQFSSVSWNVSIGGADHDCSHVTTSSLQRFYMLDTGNINHSENKALQQRFKNLGSCVVGNDVWIATNAVILRGITIGNGAVIGAGAIVRKNVEPYSIVAGVPAKLLKKRFDEDTIAVLQKICWWDWPIEVIRQHLDLIYSKKVNDRALDELLAISAALKLEKNHE